MGQRGLVFTVDNLPNVVRGRTNVTRFENVGLARRRCRGIREPVKVARNAAALHLKLERIVRYYTFEDMIHFGFVRHLIYLVVERKNVLYACHVRFSLGLHTSRQSLREELP